MLSVFKFANKQDLERAETLLKSMNITDYTVIEDLLMLSVKQGANTGNIKSAINQAKIAYTFNLSNTGAY